MRPGSLASRFRHWLADDEGALRTPRFAVVLLALYALFTGTYVAINVFSVGRSAATLYLPGEERLPFLPVFEYLYLLTFFVPVLLVTSVRTYGQFLRLVRAFAVALLVAYTTYIAFPVYLERPGLDVSSLHTWLLSVQYLDKPYNHFPSLHVTLSWLAVRSAQRSRNFQRALGLVAWGISISTLFVKQHYVVDVVFGYALAWGAWKLAGVSGVGASKSAMTSTGLSTTSAAE